MFCNKCGKKLVAGDVFCPGCGAKVEWERDEAPAEEMAFDIETPVKKEESFDFNWDLDDFNRTRNRQEKIEWGDLLGTEKKTAEEPAKTETQERKPISDFVFTPYSEERKEPDDRFKTFNRKNEEFKALLDREREKLSGEEPEEPDVVEAVETVETEPANKVIDIEIEEPEVIEEPVAAEEAEEAEEPVIVDVLEELPDVPEIEEEPAEAESVEEAEAQLEEIAPKEPERKLSFFERRRKRKEAKLAALKKAEETKVLDPLTVDEDNLSGQWPEPVPETETEAEAAPEPAAEVEPEVEAESEAVEEPAEEVLEEVKEPVNQVDEMAEARSRLFNTPIEEMVAEDVSASKDDGSRTQTLNREEFAAFLRNAEKQFGIDEIDEEIQEAVEEPVSEPEPEPEPAPEPEEVTEEVAEEPEAEVEAEEEPVEAEEDEQVEEVVDAAALVPDEPKAKSRRKVKAETGEFKLGDFEDDNFWGDKVDLTEGDVEELKKEAKKGSKLGTAVIIILSLILAAQLAVMLIRFQFPDSDIAQLIEPKLTLIENWIRGLF